MLKDCKQGKSIILAKLPWGKLGMSICYDMRFPNKYRSMLSRELLLCQFLQHLPLRLVKNIGMLYLNLEL